MSNTSAIRGGYLVDRNGFGDFWRQIITFDSGLCLKGLES